MEDRAKLLLQHSDHLFGKRTGLMTMWQEIAENFYVQRADFTASRSTGANYADNLSTSYPLQARRDLGDAFSAMLRPTSKEWFRITTAQEEALDDAGRGWLEMAAGIQRRAMYDRVTQFTRATKEADHDFATFGQCVISHEIQRLPDNTKALLYRCWHLRDVVWCENAAGKIDTVHRTWKPAARDLAKLFPGKVSEEVTKLLKDKPYEEVEVRHAVVPSDGYEWPSGTRATKTPYVSVFLEKQTGKILQEIGSKSLIYVIPRWVTVSGTQYASSPATDAALPDARLLQAMTLTLLEAGEKAVNPPMTATQEALRSDIAIYAGGITYVDADYDDRTGKAVELLTHDNSGMPLGLEMVQDIRGLMRDAFFLNKISMPSAAGKADMTAFEVAQRVQEYIRQALPLFEPVEIDYNGGLCEGTFDLLMREGAFGPPEMIPDSLKGAEIQFRFESPLNEAIEAQKAGKLGQALAIISQCVAIDPQAGQRLDVDVAEVDAMRGIRVPEKWLRTDEQVQQRQAAAAQKQAAAELLGGLQQGADVAKTLGEGAAAFSGAMPGQGAQ